MINIEKKENQPDNTKTKRLIELKIDTIIAKERKK